MHEDDNPVLAEGRGKPAVLITSGEHYGAVLNLDFNYAKYLKTLAQDGLNNTRTWAGAYCEPLSAFGIASNTLAPLPGRFICPWARGDQPGYANGGNKFDLSQWDPAYFKRLKNFMGQASKRGVIVELNLFCPFYEESMWKLSPMNAANNINGVGGVARTNVYTLDKHGGLLAVQDAMVLKIVTERQHPRARYDARRASPNRPRRCDAAVEPRGPRIRALAGRDGRLALSGTRRRAVGVGDRNRAGVPHEAQAAPSGRRRYG